MTRRTVAQRKHDRAEIARLYLRGWFQSEIAARINANRNYNITQQTVSNDLKEIQRQWLESSERDFDALRAQELAKIDHLERTYWSAWERSCEDAATQRVEGSAAEGDSTRIEADKVVTTTKGQTGDPQFLRGVERCIERRCTLLGLDEPDRVNLGGDGILVVSGFNLDEI